MSRSKPSSTIRDEDLSHTIALVQGRTTGMELGIAIMSMNTSNVVLTQMVDGENLSRTLQLLDVYPVTCILLPDTPDCDHLMAILEEQTGVRPTRVLRSWWNRDEGLLKIQDLAHSDGHQASTLMAAADRYLALCATAALFRWIENQDIQFMKGALRFRYVTNKDVLFIDPDSSANLELVANALSHKAQNTLYGLLDQCFTPMGSRMLRNCILQPNTNLDAIFNRLDSVEELVNDPTKLDDIRRGMKPLAKVDFENILSKLGKRALFEQKATHLLQLRQLLSSAQSLSDRIGRSGLLLTTIKEKITDDALQQLAALIDEHLCAEATLGKASKSLAARQIKLYAVRKEVSPLLDVARMTYGENNDDIQELAKGYDAYLTWTETGYRLVTQGVVPPDAINVEASAKRTRYTTRELLKRNTRMLAAQQEIFMLSDQIIDRLLVEVVQEMGALYECSESIAVLDLLTSFANVSRVGHVRPTFGDATMITQGRHPVLNRIVETVPNDVYATDGESNLQIIQGPNMSGKSTFIRQVGLLTVQALIGCFVPAEYAVIRVPDAILTRLSNDDSIERSLSTFASEMATTAMILTMSTPRSLVLIDELGRGTSSTEGMGMAHAVAEALAVKRCTVFFATHYLDLAKTLKHARGVVNLHFDTYKVVKGPVERQHYGIELAKLAFPESVTARALEVAKQLSVEDRSEAKDRKRSALLGLRRKLESCRTSVLDDAQIAVILRRYQDEYIDVLSS